MRLFPEDIEERLGFDSIRDLLREGCHSSRGIDLVGRLKPTDDSKLLAKWHDQVREMLGLLAEHKDSVSMMFVDIDEFLVRVKVPGSFLDAKDFHDLRSGLATMTSWVKFLESHKETYQVLSALSKNIEVDDSLEQAIDRAIDERGEVRDNASPELAQIRHRIVKSERSVRSAVQRILKKAKGDDLTDDDSSVTIRDGRLVIPIRSEFKRKISGFVHDESATGQTVFVEPTEVLELNNEVNELRYAERREIIRILVALSDELRRLLPELRKGADLLEKLDLIHAKCRLTERLEASAPTFSSKREVHGSMLSTRSCISHIVIVENKQCH